MDEGRGAPVIFYHRDCGHAFTPMVVCSVLVEEVGLSSKRMREAGE